MKPLSHVPIVGHPAGVKVMVFYTDRAPPHVHLEKGESQVVVEILEPRIPPGLFTAAETKTVTGWIKANRVPLLTNWALAQAGHPLFAIEGTRGVDQDRFEALLRKAQRNAREANLSDADAMRIALRETRAYRNEQGGSAGPASPRRGRR